MCVCVCVEADCPKAKLTPVRDLSTMFSECPLVLRRCLNLKPSNPSFSEELVLNNLIASPLMKPYFTPGGWHEPNCVNWKVSVGL